MTSFDIGKFVHFDGFSGLSWSAKQSPSSTAVEIRVAFDNGEAARSLIWQLQEAAGALKDAARQKKGRRGVKADAGKGDA